MNGGRRGRRDLLIVLGAVTFLSLTPVPASALSCRPLQDRYILVCDEAACQSRFRARDVPSQRFRPCPRHVVLEEFPSWAVAPIEEALRTGTERPLFGTVEVILEYRPLLVGLPGAEPWLRRAMQARETRLTIRRAVEGEAALRAALERRSADELWAARKVWALDVLSASVVTFTLLWSCVWFIRRVAGLTRRAQLRLLVSMLALDTLVFIVGGLAGATSSAPVALVATLLSMLVALVESVTCAVTLYRGPRIHEPSAV